MNGECDWFFDGTEYGESLQYPHACLNGTSCPQPPVPDPPPPYGDKKTTQCV